MKEVELVSFDAEGTLVTPDFSAAIWHEAIPALYAHKTGLELDRARESVYGEYESVGDQRLEWYDIHYWFRRLDLGSPEPVIHECLSRVDYYPEVMRVLSSLGRQYTLVVASCTPRLFLDHLLEDIESRFARVFSSISHFGQVKNPGFYLRMCEEMGVGPGQAVHVGDNWQMDFVNSREAGLHAVYLDRSGSTDHESITDLTQVETLLS